MLHNPYVILYGRFNNLDDFSEYKNYNFMAQTHHYSSAESLMHLLKKGLENTQASETYQEYLMQTLQETILQEFNLPQIQPNESQDVFSARWYQIFQENTQKIERIFKIVGIPSEKVQDVLYQYNRKAHQNLWSQA